MTKASDTRKKSKGVKTSQEIIVDPSADGELVDIKGMDENWSEYTLKDGSVIRIKPVVIEVRRMKEHYAPNNDPIYFIKSTVITDTTINQSLKRKS